MKVGHKEALVLCPFGQKELSGKILAVLFDRNGKCSASNRCKKICPHKK